MAEKIYCTNCGREIKEGLLYCDRCGQSVKKSMERQFTKSDNRLEAERIHREQIERKKRRNEKEKKKQKKRRKATQHAWQITLIAGIVILAVVIGVTTYILMSRNSSIVSNEDIIQDDIAKNSPPATDRAVTSSSGNDAGFKLCQYNGMACPYPADFTPQSTSGKQLINVTESLGGAVMTIAYDTADISAGTSTAARDLMTAYYDETSAQGNVTENRSGSNWYIITYSTGEKIHHRKCVISGQTLLYYDFEYDESSVKAQEYANCITKLDDNFNAEASTQQ